MENHLVAVFVSSCNIWDGLEQTWWRWGSDQVCGYICKRVTEVIKKSIRNDDEELVMETA